MHVHGDVKGGKAACVGESLSLCQDPHLSPLQPLLGYIPNEAQWSGCVLGPSCSHEAGMASFATLAAALHERCLVLEDGERLLEAL